jgi:hypothetical protein
VDVQPARPAITKAANTIDIEDLRRANCIRAELRLKEPTDAVIDPLGLMAGKDKATIRFSRRFTPRQSFRFCR